MSESDDTDELLSVHPEISSAEILHDAALGPYYQIVEKLILQVSKLSDRVNNIENTESFSDLDSRFPSSISTDNVIMERANPSRRCQSYESLLRRRHVDKRPQPSFSSTQSTPQKPKTNLTLQTPLYIERENEKYSDLLGEAIKFYTEFKLKPRVARNLNFNDADSNSTTPTEGMQPVLSKLEEQKKNLEEVQNSKLTNILEDKADIPLEVVWKCKSANSNSSSSTDLTTILCNPNALSSDLNLTEEDQNIIETNDHPNEVQDVFLSKCSNEDIDTLEKDYGSLILNMLMETGLSDRRKPSNLHRDSNPSSDNPEQSNKSTMVPENIRQLLKNHSNNEFGSSSETGDSKRAQEVIEKLQTKTKQQADLLLVAEKMNRTKDKVVVQFLEACKLIMKRVKEATEEKQQLEKDYSNLMHQSNQTIETYRKQLELYEKKINESSAKAQVDVKKFESVVSECESLRMINQDLKSCLKNEENKSKQLSKIVGNKEIELTESKTLLIEAKNETSHCREAIETFQKEFSSIKVEHACVLRELELKDQDLSNCRRELAILTKDLESEKEINKNLQKKLEASENKIEINKSELKIFYQGQVELLVQTKLKEFQKQLEDEQTRMRNELNKKEVELASFASAHIKEMNKKNSLEVHLLEEKHLQEINLRDARIAQLEQRLSAVLEKLDHQQEQRTNLIKQLQKVMETQWNEALRIIDSSKNPPTKPNAHSTIDQLHSLHSESYQNMESLLHQGGFKDSLSNQPYRSNFKQKEQKSSESNMRRHKECAGVSHPKTPLTRLWPNHQPTKDQET